MSSSVHIDKVLTCIQSILLRLGKKIVLSLYYNGENSYLFVNGIEIHKFKAKDSETKPTPLCLGKVSKNFSVNNMKNTRFMVIFTILVLIMMLLLLIY